MKISRSLQIIIAIVIVLILTSIVWPANPATKGIMSAGNLLINPIRNAVKDMSSGTSGFLQNIRDIRKLAEINKDLERENKILIQNNSRLKELKHENDVLRTQLKFSQESPEYNLTVSKVIGRDPSNLLQFITINKGAKDGIKKGMPVISEGFLVGKISSVSKRSSKVFLITNPSSVVNALVQESRATGIIRVGLGYNLILESISQDAKVELGNAVVTSGIGETFPKGLIIGKINNVDERQSEVFKKAEIEPLIDITSLEVVFVITK